MIIGIILLLVGGAGLAYGIHLNNSIEAKLESIFSNGSTDPGTIYIVAGAVVACIGLILIIRHIVMNGNPSRGSTGESVCAYCGYTVVNGERFCQHCGKEILNEKNETVCLYCGAEIDTDARFCPKCGSDLKLESKPVSRPEPQPAPVPPANTKVCSHCRRENPSSAKACGYCGVRFDEDNGPWTSPDDDDL